MNTPTTTAAIPVVEALLLDMDGVLAEVSQSYRCAIIQTAAHYNVTITSADIEQAKLAGNANNDWHLTHRLVNHASASAQVTLEQITQTFENLYQGPEGLCQTETLLVSKGLLEELSSRVSGRMAIVTGRPKSDCQAFLDTHDLGHLFPVCICMEDGPAKPAPDSIQLALKRLGLSESPVNGAVMMIGDTVDDIVAAVAAGVTGMGVWTPDAYAQHLTCGGGHSSVASRLREVGSAQMLQPGLGQLLDLIPRENATNMTSLKGNRTRIGRVHRETKETSISVTLNLDGTGKSKVRTF